MSTTRRNLALGVVAAGGGLLLANCTQQQVDDTAKKIAEVITAIQSGVKQGCEVAGTVIPTATSVLQVIGAMFAVSPIILTGVQIAQVIAAIVEQACKPADGAQLRRSGEVKVNGVTVVFY